MAFGQLHQNGTQQPLSEINVTPLVDVMLVLLVLFIVTAPLLTHKIKLNLPHAQTHSEQTPKSISVSINLEGKIFIDTSPVTDTELAEKIKAQLQTNPNTTVELHADGELAYKKVAAVMASLQNAGVTKLMFAANPNGAASK